MNQEESQEKRCGFNVERICDKGCALYCVSGDFEGCSFWLMAEPSEN